MVSSVLSVLLLGMVPLWRTPALDVLTPSDLSLASPSPLIAEEVLSEDLSASGMIIVDIESGQQIAARSPMLQLPIASLTKLMTALIILENHELGDLVEVSSNISETEGTIANLPPGEHFTVGSLLSALLIASGNDAAETLAQFHSGSEEAFAEEMNERAAALGLLQTSFVNASGLDAQNQWSTPREIGWLARFVIRHDELYSRMQKRGMTIVSAEGTAVSLIHTHALLHGGSNVIAGQPDRAIVLAGKTGTTESAGQCLLSIVLKGGRRYLVVLLRSNDRYRDMRMILSAFDRALST